MRARIFDTAFQPHDEMRARMYSGKTTDSKRIENAEYVELSFLREVCAVSENRERDVHRRKVEARGRNS